MTERKIALSIEEAADYTGIGRNTLRKLVEWKKLPVLKLTFWKSSWKPTRGEI